MSSFLGIAGAVNLETHMSLNARRKIFYLYPNGGAPFTALLSMMEAEGTDKQEFGWYEKRKAAQFAYTAGISTAGPFSASGGDTALSDGADLDQGTVYRVRTAAGGTAQMRVGHSIWIANVPLNAGGTGDAYGVITEITATNKFEMLITTTLAGISSVNSEYPSAGCYIRIVGSAFTEAARSKTGIYNLPDLSNNYTQIFRTPFSFSASAMQASLKFDESGIYNDRKHDAFLQHMTEMERAFLFGQKSKQTTTNENSDSVYLYTTSGVRAFLKAWDTANSATDDSDSNKRIIVNSTGQLSRKTLHSYWSRLFKNTNDRNFEKLCLCGSGHLETINEALRQEVQISTSFLGDEKFKFKVTTVETLNGTIHFRTHPMFNEDPGLQYDGMYLDILNFKFRHLNNRDTTLKTHIEDNDFDGRKDEFFTEAGLECINAPSHMIIQNLQSIV